MERLAKNLIFALLIVSAVCVADLSSGSADTVYISNQQVSYSTNKNFMGSSSENNSEFWSKFRESVMPDDSQKNKPSDNKKTPPPDMNVQRPPKDR